MWLRHLLDRPARALRPARSWLVITVLSAVAVVGCSPNSTVATSPTGSKCQVALAASSSVIDNQGGLGTITVTTAPECPWDVSTSANWLSGLSPASGQGTGTVEFRAAPNPLPAARDAEILVNDNRLRVSQQAAPCRFELRPDTLQLSAAGGTRDIAVSAPSGCSWTVVPDSNWISFTTPVSRSGDGIVGVRIAPNPGTDRRIGGVFLGDQRVTITQDGEAAGASPCVFVVSSTGQSVLSADAAQVPVTVSAASGCAWTASSDVGWITVTGGIGNGTGVFGLSVAANPGGVRTGTVTAAGQSFTVTQAGAAGNPCTYSIAPPSSSFVALGGAGSVEITTSTGCPWTATSNAAWITVTVGAGTGNGAMAFTVQANPGSARTGTIIIGDQTFTVTQAAAATPCTYTLGATSATIAATGGTGTVTVTSGTGCAWTATSNASWITITAGAAGTGNGAVAFTVAANAGGARTGTVAVAGQTFTVTQAAGASSCSYGIAPTSAAIAAPGGSGTVTVSTSTGCAWTASSEFDWITITSGTSGTGNGPVAFSVGANSGGARTGVISIAGRAFTVTQAAATCTYALGSPAAAVAAPGGTGTVTVSTGTSCAWTAVSNTTWITVTSGASGTGNGAVAFSVAANTGGARMGTITIAGQTFTVTQAAVAPCTYSLTPTTASSAAAGGIGTFAVSAGTGCAWTATSNAAWITVTSGASGSGTGTVAYLVANNAGSARMGTITAAGQTFTVSQAAAPVECTYTITPTSLSVNNSAQTRTVAVSAGSSCAWTATSNTPWITITSGASGQGNGSVAFSIPANTTDNDRTGTITIAGRTFTLTQRD